MKSKIRVLIVEDHHLFRQALTHILSLDESIRVVGECRTPEEAIVKIKQSPVDVLVVDLAWRGDARSGIKLIHRALALAPETKVIVCSGRVDDESIRLAIQAGAQGYLLKDEAVMTDIVRAVKAVQCDRPAYRDTYSDTVIQVMARLLRRAPEDKIIVDPLGTLTAREREVVPLLVDGLSNAEIAQRLGVTEKTVKTHVSHILHKLNLSSRHQVAGYLRR